MRQSMACMALALLMSCGSSSSSGGGALRPSSAINVELMGSGDAFICGVSYDLRNDGEPHPEESMMSFRTTHVMLSDLSMVVDSSDHVTSSSETHASVYAFDGSDFVEDHVPTFKEVKLLLNSEKLKATYKVKVCKFINLGEFCGSKNVSIETDAKATIDNDYAAKTNLTMRAKMTVNTYNEGLGTLNFEDLKTASSFPHAFNEAVSFSPDTPWKLIVVDFEFQENDEGLRLDDVFTGTIKLKSLVTY